MIVYGLLYLMGYDYIDDVEVEEMESKEIDIFVYFGIVNFYEFID